MGLLQELERYFSKHYDESLAEDNNESLAKENEQLRKKYDELSEKYSNACYEIEILKVHKKTLLDEVTLCQQRIDSLLRQLREKNGGK